MKLQSGFALTLIVSLVGCGSSQTMPVIKVPRGKPAHFRFVNLTDASIAGKVGPLYPLDDIRARSMTGAMPVSPGRSYKVWAKIGKKEMQLDLPAKPGQFTTVVVKSAKLSGFVSGNSISSPAGASLDLINLTNRPVDFNVDGSVTKVGPNDSKSLDRSVGKVTVSTGSSNKVDADLGKAQIWGIYAVEENSKIFLRTVSLKGSGQAAGTGGPSAS